MAKKAGFVVIIGETNAGKSTFVNEVVGAKVSIVSHKVQTTRFKVLGIYTKEDSQIVFVDTPGIFSPRRELDRAMLRHSFMQMADADIIMVLLDGTKKLNDHFKSIINKIPKNKKVIAVVNKTDLINKEQLVILLKGLQEYMNVFQEVFMISALKNHKVSNLISYILNILPENEWFFEEDQISDLPLRKLAEEITREKIYKYLNEELPYNCFVEGNKWEEDGNKITIYQTIYVLKDSHKRIVLGASGEKIKNIRVMAMESMKKEFGKKVSLFLYVKVDKHLLEKPKVFEDMGLERDSN